MKTVLIIVSTLCALIVAIELLGNGITLTAIFFCVNYFGFKILSKLES